MPKKRKHNSRILKKKHRIGGDGLVRLVRRFAGGVIALTICVWLAAWVWFGGFVEQGMRWATSKTIQATEGAGFHLDNLFVEGRTHIDAGVLIDILDLEVGASLFQRDLEDIRIRVEALEWVEAVNIQRRPPNDLYIRITERTPVALWRGENSKNVFLIDKHGHIIDVPVDERFRDYLIISGQGGNDEAFDLVSQLMMYPEIVEAIDGGIWVGERRWDLLTKQGARIRMPADDFDYALGRLEEIRLRSDVFAQPLEMIDLRQTDRVIARPKDGHVLEYDHAIPAHVEEGKKGYKYEL